MATSPVEYLAPRRKGARLFRACVSRLSGRWRAVCGKFRYLVAHAGFRQSPAVTLCRLLRWKLLCTLGTPATVILQPWKIRFYLPPRWYGAGTTMIYALRGNYELELIHLNRFLSPGMVVIDGGASCGIYTTVAAKLVGPNGLVLSFEPGAESFYALKQNVRLNRFENVRTYRAALSDKEGKAALYHHDGPNSFSLGHPDTPGVAFEEVVTCTLSRVVHEQTCSPVGMIKLDVEGAEELVLRGAESIIAFSRPTILLEMNGAAAKRLGLSREGAWQLLEGFGYRFFSMRQQGELCRLHHPPATDDIVNVLAIHGEQPK